MTLPYSSLTPQHLDYVVANIPRDVRALMYSGKIILGGGFVRSILTGEKVSDIDLFGPTTLELSDAAYALAKSRNGRVHETKNAFTVLSDRTTVQFIIRWLFYTPEAAIASFDFTIAQAAIWHTDPISDSDNGWHSLIAPTYYSDLATKALVYTFPVRKEDAGGSLMRVRKFLRMGYQIRAASLAGVCARLFNSVNWSILRGENEAEREAETAKILQSLLQEVDPALIVDGKEVLTEEGDGIYE